jgi:hypothetical protein
MVASQLHQCASLCFMASHVHLLFLIFATASRGFLLASNGQFIAPPELQMIDLIVNSSFRQLDTGMTMGIQYLTIESNLMDMPPGPLPPPYHATNRYQYCRINCFIDDDQAYNMTRFSKGEI